METDKRYLVFAIVCVGTLIALLFSIRVSPARDLGQWDAADVASRGGYVFCYVPSGGV